MRPCTAAVPLAVLGTVLLGACSSNPTAAAPPPPLPSATNSSSAPPSSPSVVPNTDTSVVTPAPTTTASPTAVGCAPAGSGIPTGASSKPIIDVDGDGRPDVGWINGGTSFGITTASGATFSIPMELAGGGPRSVLVENTDGKGTIAALASDGRTVELLVVKNCGLFPVTNPQGQHYEFDLGLRGTGTGVGCSQVAGTSGRSLVGLNVHVDGNGHPLDVQRTQIVLDGTAARNGATDTVAGNPAAAQSGSQISCGDLTMTRDGVSERK